MQIPFAPHLLRHLVLSISISPSISSSLFFFFFFSPSPSPHLTRFVKWLGKSFIHLMWSGSGLWPYAPTWPVVSQPWEPASVLCTLLHDAGAGVCYVKFSDSFANLLPVSSLIGGTSRRLEVGSNYRSPFSYGGQPPLQTQVFSALPSTPHPHRRSKHQPRSAQQRSKLLATRHPPPETSAHAMLSTTFYRGPSINCRAPLRRSEPMLCVCTVSELLNCLTPPLVLSSSPFIFPQL